MDTVDIIYMVLLIALSPLLRSVDERWRAHHLSQLYKISARLVNGRAGFFYFYLNFIDQKLIKR